MTKVEAIEQEIGNLPPEDLAKFRAWFLEFDAQRWDEQIENDALSGKFNDLAGKALTAHRQGKSLEF